MDGPVVTRAAVQFDLGGHVGRYLEAVNGHWLKAVPLANPGILEMLRERDRRPLAAPLRFRERGVRRQPLPLVAGGARPGARAVQPGQAAPHPARAGVARKPR
jgi:hypothetical protein